MKGKKTGGRKKGTPNKDSLNAETIAEKLGVDPFKILLHFANGNWKALGYKEQTVTKFAKGGEPYKEDVISPELRGNCSARACEFILPKRKAIEQTFADDTITEIVRTIITRKV